MVLTHQTSYAQDKLSWLDEYTGEMQIGSDTYHYNFYSVESNDCKLKFEELVTDKKGKTEARSWILYLSDLNPSAISFKAKGKSINISMETQQSQKFISYFEEGELDADFSHCYKYGSTTTILVAEIASKGIKLTPEEATLCCLGIYEDTGNLT